MSFDQYQQEIYLEGLSGKTPEFPLELAELERRFEEEVEPALRDYVSASAGLEDTDLENLEAFRRWRIVPKMLTNVQTRDLSTTIFGSRIPAPVLLAPIGGVQGGMHPEGEVAVARVASSLGIPLVLSTV